ncbi:MAG: hypothetical protein ACYTER_08170 [Planctomycetota bacterium]
MAQRDYTSHQKNIISNYYKNLDAILLTRLQEMVTELYLADSAKKKTQLWARVEQALTKLKIPAEIKSHILEKQDTELLARHLQDWLRK